MTGAYCKILPGVLRRMFGTFRGFTNPLSQLLRFFQTATIFDLWKKQTQFQTVKDNSQKTLPDLQKIDTRFRKTGGDLRMTETVFWSIRAVSRPSWRTFRRLQATPGRPAPDRGRPWGIFGRGERTALRVRGMVPDCLNIASNCLMNASHRLEL